MTNSVALGQLNKESTVLSVISNDDFESHTLTIQYDDGTISSFNFLSCVKD